MMDTMISSGMLPEFIDNMIEQVNEDKLWQLYLAIALMEDRPFADWKAAVLSGNTVKDNSSDKGNITGGLSPEAAVVHAEGILAGFRPF